MASERLFLSHAWAKDTLGRDNHKRVARLNDGLRARKLATWFDAQGDMAGNTLQAMTNGIDESSAVAIFVTREYIEKCKKPGNDNCKLEFEYAYQRKTVENLIPVVMEPACTSPASWDGPVGAVLGTQLYIDCTGDSDKDYEKALDEIAARFKKVQVGEEKQEEEAADKGGSQQATTPKKLLVVSSPEYGPDGQGPDGKTKYTFPVMEQIAALAKNEDGVLVAYDWAGSSNAFDEDKPVWEELGKAASFEQKATLVKKTKWFVAFSGQVKGAVRSACQEGFHTVMVCIAGGPISQVEAQQMPQIREEIVSDLGKLGIEPVIEIRHLASFEDLQELVSALRPNLGRNASINAEEKVLGEDMFAVLESTQSEKLAGGRKYIETGNLEEAQAQFEGMLQQSKSLSADELKTAKLLLAFTLAKKGLNRLRVQRFDEAALIFQQITTNWCDVISHARLQKFRLFHACALYEAGKHNLGNGDLGAAKKRFEATKTGALPNNLQEKVLDYIRECTQRSKELREQAKLEEKTEKIEFNEENNDEKQAFALYKKAKRALANGNFSSARRLFEQARESDDLPEALNYRALKYSDVIDELEINGTKTGSVFSDNCTHVLLGSSKVTLDPGVSTATLGFVTKPAWNESRNQIAVLNCNLPVDTAAQEDLWAKWATDMSKTLAHVNGAIGGAAEQAITQIYDFCAGSVIIYFRFVGTDEHNAAFLEEEYLKQVDDKTSALYQGEVTCRIDQKRTQTMTMQLHTNSLAQTPCTYQPGDTITLAQVGDETIACQVESRLGEGATATVFQVATNGKFGALKVFKAENGLEDLCTEASLMLTANFPTSHPNVLRADFVWYEARTHEMFFLLGLADGGDLQGWMDDERLYAGTVERVRARLFTIVDQIARGLRHLHRLGILHQDNKPENVLLTRDGRPLLADLGVANQGVLADGMVEATLRGGTPVYASPHVRQLFFKAKALPVTQRAEFLQQHPITHRDDFFALGATVLDIYSECGWRRGRSVAEVLESAGGGVAQLVRDVRLRVPVPEAMVVVLQTCFGVDEALTLDSVVALTSELSTDTEPDETEGMAAGRSASIRNNLGLALFDGGVRKQEHGEAAAAARCFEAASAQLERAVEAQPEDARALNNLGVVKWAQGETDAAKRHFDDALKANQDHKEATFNVGVVQGNREGVVAPVTDRTGAAAGAVGDGRGKVELASAVRFASEQQLELHRRGKWELVRVADIDTPMELTYRLPIHEAPKYAPEQQLLVIENGEWRRMQADTTSMPLDATNHAPALFDDAAAMARAQQAHTIELKDKHTYILDLFSGQKLNTRTQTVMLRYREKERAAQTLSKDADVDSELYQRARKASQMERSDTTTVTSDSADAKATTILREMLGGDDYADARLRRYLLLILGPAASGKTTLLKTFMMEMVHTYPDFVPVLIPVIDVVKVLGGCNRDAGESVVSKFVRSKYAQHAHLLLQAMLQRRAVFLIDGIDESGTYREPVQDFITVELLKPGHKTIITSRHSGFSSDAFKQCRLVELLPLSPEQQAKMVRTRVEDEARAEALVKELGAPAFKDIATNPLMLSMMVSVYVSNGYVVISNRSELYEKALRTFMGRSDTHRAGLELAAQEELLAHLQKLASASHRREGERRIFTVAQANDWAGEGGWAAIVRAMNDDRLPIIAKLGPNDKDEDEYRFGHMSYQEYLTGREYYKRFTAARFAAATVKELFGDPPAHAFADVKHHLMLQLLAGILSAEQRSMCLAVMCGGRVEVQVLARKQSRRSTTSLRCVVVGCAQLHRNADGYCHNHRAEAAAALAEATVRRGDALRVISKELGKAGAEAMAPYVREDTRLRTLVLRKTKLGADGMRVLVGALTTNTVLTALDVAENELKTEGAKAVAELVSANGALTSLNISANSLAPLVYPGGWKSQDNDNRAPFVGPNGQRQDKDPRIQDMSGVIALANAIKNNGALVKFDVSKNNFGKEGTKALAEALNGNQIMAELNLAENSMGNNGAMDIAKTIPTMGAMKKLTISGDDQYGRSKPVTIETSMTEADFSGKYLMTSGAIMLAAFLPKCQAMTSLTVSGEDADSKPVTIETSMAKADFSGKHLGASGTIMLASFLPKCQALTTLDLSSNELGAEGTMHVAEAIKGHGALVKFDLSNNMLLAAGAKVLAEALHGNQVMTELNLSQNRISKKYADYSNEDMSGVIAISDAIPTMGALTSLNISTNGIGTVTAIEKKKVPSWSIGDEVEWRGLGGKAVYWGGNPRDYIGFQPLAGVIALANAIKNNGALVSANLLNNKISVEQAQNLATILKEHATLKSLCGNKGDETELNMSGKKMGADGAIMLAPEIVANGAMVSVNILNNNIGNEQAQNLVVILKKHATLKSLCGNKGDETELDMSGKKMGTEGAIMLAPEIVANGAMVTVNMMGNNIGKEQLSQLQEMMKAHPTLISLCGIADDATEANLSGLNMDADDAAVLADELPAKGALEKVNISNNSIIHYEEEQAKAAGKALSDALAQNTVLKELHLSKNAPYSGSKGPAFAQEFAAGLGTNGALVKFDISNNLLCAEGTKAVAKALKGNTSMTELNISSNYMSSDSQGNPGKDMSGVMDITNAIPTMGALTILNLSSNKLGSMGAKYVAEAIKVNGAMTSLNISNNNLGEIIGWTYYPEAEGDGLYWTYTHSDGRKQHEKPNEELGGKPEGVIAIANAIPTMGAMTTLNISSNYLYDAGADALASALKAPNCALTSVDASNNNLTGKGEKALQQAASSRVQLKL